MSVLVRAEKELTFLHWSQIDIIANILSVANRRMRKIHIMYSCNLGFRQLQIYLDFLLKNEFLKPCTASGKNEFFEATSKDLALLDAYRSLKLTLGV